MHVMATMPSVPTPVPVACVLLLLVYVQLTTQATPPPCNPGDNLYAPVFIDSEVRKTVPETLPTGASVATLRASDNDTVCNFGTLTYNITGDGSAVTYFQIDQDTGRVSVRTSLTNTSIIDFTVRIVAQDGSSPPWIATALLYVKVTRNLVGPVWSSATYATNIPETAQVLENILRVTATDSDAQPPNNEVSYELVGDAIQLYYFEIVSSTGDIRPRRPLTLDTSRRSRFDFVVNARDNGSPRLSAAFNATVTISVYRNNNAPRFIQDPYSITVNQGLGSGTVISVRAVDDDPTTEFNQITYSIEGPANALALFTIDGSGNIQPTNPAAINSASQTSYKIYVRAEDNGSPKLYDIALVELTINRNLNPPIFNPVNYEVTILETRPIGDVILRVTATDADNQIPNNEITFSAFGSGLTFFNVNSQTGEVTVVNNLVQDSTTRYQLTIQAQDKGASPLSSAQPASVTINVVRNQASPVFQQIPYNTTVLRTAGANTPVVTVTATDADTRSPYNEVTYGIASMTVNRFQINPSTGEITLTQAIASDSQAQYGVTVFAQDGGNPRRVTYNTFTVGVDRNLNAPFLINPSGPNFENSTTVLETIGFDYLIYDVDAFDADLSDPYRSLRFSIIGENTAPTYFLINRDSGEIRLKSSLLQDTLQTLQYRLVISVTDGGDPPRPAPTTATITVNAIRNLNTPRWVNEPYSATIDETIGANVNIVNVLAVDDDTNAFNRVSYAIIGDGTASAYFDVTPGGTIIRKQSLQSVSDTRFYLRVVASDNGVPPKTNTTVVSIIINRNLNTPTFSQLLFTTEIDETTEVGTAVLRISATDQDSVPPYNTVEFAQIPNSATGLTFFSLEADTGNVVLRRPLTGNPDLVYEFQALVRDKGVPSLEQAQRATVRITVRRNNNDPLFVGSPYSVTINEDQTVGSQILPVVVQDSDVNNPFNQVTLRVIGDEKGPLYFGLANNQINVSRDLTLDTGNDLRYTLRIEARDGGSPARSATALAYITVNRNLRPPVFTTQDYSARIPETQQLAVSIVQVQAADGDRVAPFNTVRYEISSLSSSALGRQYFMVDPNTGVVSVRRNLETDTSDTSVYRFVVDAIDGSGVRAALPANVEITVDRNLFPPVFITANYTAVINNTTPQNSPVFTALATDRDSQNPFNVVQYSIIGDDGSQSYFNINPGSGEVTLAQPVFSIPNTQFRVRLQARDGSGLTDVAVLTVYIQRNLFAPVLSQTIYERVIQETTPVSTSILNLFAQDSDQTAPYSTVSYYTSGSSERFLVDVNNGVVSVRRSLIGESGQTFTFQVYAQDGGTPPLRSQFATVRINVTRNNFPPVFINEPYSQSLLATASAGDGVVRVSAPDADTEFPFDDVKYDIIGDDNAQNFFQIDESSGQISLRNTFGSDGAELYRIRVRARDGGNPRLSDITVVSVNVTRNLRAPVFNTPSYTARILEITNFGEVFVSVSAQDSDTSAPNNVLTYQLTGNSECQRYFGINTNGGLYVQADLVADPTRASLYICQVSAQDQGNPRRDSTNQATVSISVIRNTAPQFIGLPYNAVLQRNVTTGTLVGTFTISDSDTGAPFNEQNYRILGDGNAPALFNLNGNNLVVTSATDLAAEALSSYTVRLEVRDGGRSGLSATTVMNIQVIRNLATPIFSNSFVERNINENYPVGGLITILNAIDSDPQAPNNVLTYLALNPSGPEAEYFYVNPINGEVRTQKSFTGSAVRQLDFLVRVQDGGSPRKTAIATVRVNVARDDQSLAFRQTNYVYTIVENTPVTTNILNVEAIPGPDVTYRLTGFSDSGDFFSVNPSNGQITLIKDLTTDVSRRTTFYLQVEAEKQFTVNLQKATSNVTITVTRNPNGPVFNETDSIYEVTIDETRELGSTILQLYAPDADRDTVRYEVINYQTGETDFFYLGPFSGLVRVAKPLTSTNTRRFEFTVRARDGMNPERSSTAGVIVIVQSDNQPPAFINEPYVSGINFNDPVGTRVFTAQAMDPDRIGAMNYELTGQYLSAPAFFRVDRASGEIFLSQSIAAESASSYFFLSPLGLSTFDSARPYRKDLTNLTITVNKNPNAPVFTTASYDRTISETYDLGVSVIQIEASDPDGQTLSYSVEAATPAGCDSYFLLVSSGLIVASRALTTSTLPQCTLNLRIQDNGVPVRQSAGIATATIRIDRNLNAPVIGGGPYTRAIPENQNVGFTVFQIQASDADQTNTAFSQLEYSLIGDDNTVNFFEINSQTGVFTVRSPLDRNNIDRYVARVVVKDGGSPRRSASITGIVTILRNLNGPVFDRSFYNVTIFETQDLTGSIERVTATDADRAGPQSEFTFSLVDLTGNFASTYFRIDASSGNIYVRLPLTQDPSDTPSVEFSVGATDQGVPQQTSTPNARVRVNIIRNQFPPVFQNEPYTASIDFTAPTNSPVTNVLATDADTSSPYNVVTYSLIGDGVALSLFSVNPGSGAISTRTTLSSDNREQYVLRLVATDGGTPRLTDTSTVLVTVNRNLNAPRLQPQNYSVEILATQTISIPILTINAVDSDAQAPYNTIVFRPTSSALFNEYFGVDPSSGAVYVKKDLGLRSDLSSYVGTVSVCDSASSPRCSDAPSYVTILVKHNLNTPFFINEPYRRDLQRSLGAGTGVLTAQAVDRDDPTTIFGQIRYTLIGDDQAPNFFSINPTTGLVEISNELGQTSDNLYQLRIQACDLGGLCNRTTAIVTITTNFQAPIISPATYNEAVLETLSLGTPIIDVNATDADPTAPNNQITYVISDGPEDLECFTINPDTGDITARLSLLYNPCTASVYSMQVVARDRGSPSLDSTPASVTINVRRNDFPPVFNNEPYTTNLREDAIVNDPVFTVNAVDRDAVAPFNTIQFTLIGDDTAPVYFDIRQTDNNNAQIYVKAPVLNDDKTTYIVRVRAADGGIPSKSDTTTVLITVNRNLFAPRFDPIDYNISISETQALGLSIFQVTATDRDSKAPYNTVQYEINSPLSSPLGRLYFMVDPNTGDVSLRCYLESDTSNTSVYTLVVDAVDGGGRRANRSANVKITVDRKTPLQPPKDNDTMSLRASVCCQEPLPLYWGGSTTTTPTPSTCGPMTDASLGEDCSNARCVAVNSSCVTTSAGSRRCACVNKNVQISATECSMGPSVLSSTTNYVFSTDLSRTSVTVGSIMFDGLSTFPTNAFSIEGQVYPDEGILYIKRNSRHIDVALVKEISNAKTFVVALRATSGEFTVQQVVTVRITSSTFTPEDVTVMLVEGTRKGTLIADVRTISSLGGYSNFEMETTDQTARALFNVTTSGQVLCGQDMILSDFTNNDTVAKEYIFSVKTRGQSATIATFYILLFKGSFLTRLDENWVGDILTYSITSSKFQVDINDTLPDGLNLTKNLTSVRLVNAIDFDAGIKSIDFKLDLVTTDRTKSTTVDVHINIDDLNDEPPELNERVYDFTVLAGSKRDTVVGVVDVTDGDTVGWITFHLEGENKDDFSINDDGVLTSEVDLTRGRFPSAIPLRVKAYDGVTYSDEVNITVYLMSYTINAGNLNKTFHGRVSENSPGAFVANVTVPNYTGYKFRNSRAHRFFSLNSTSGIVTTAIGLDRENDDHAHTEFTILAYMGSDDQCLPLTIGQLITNIMDLNDNTPEFSRPSYTGGVKENSIPGTLVDDLVDIAVTDEDTGVNGSVNFALTGPGKTYFAVEKSNHNKFTIKTSGTPVDREVTPYVVLTLTGTDNPSNPNTGTTTLNITIIDVNDNVPQFNSGTTVFWVEENVQPKTITTLTATDKDEGFSAKISYSLKDGGFGFFKVDESTGEVSTTKAIDRESRKVFNLSIEARDQGSPFQESVLTITVNIRDVNDEKPTFTKNSYKSHYTENSPCDRNILTMTATDQDEGSNATIRFSTTSSYFTVDPTSGAIRCVVPLDYEEMRQHLIEIKAENPGFPTMSDTVTVEINVEDVNDNSPRFNKAKYQSEITTLEWVTDNPVDVFDVTDDDSGKNGQFRFSMNGETDTFYIDGDTVGLLRIKEGASQPVASTTYNFDVTATDKGSPSLNVTVPVSVDVKKIQGTSTVRFSSNDLSFSIQEEKIYTTSFGRANASHDASVSVRYTLIHGGDFHIDPSSGALTCSKALDRETAANHTMVVRVRDIATNASDLAVIKITVEDENDNGPRFLTIPEQHVFSVKEDSAVDTFIARIMAHDKDAGDNGTVTYSIELQTPRTHFYIHPGTGRITVSGDLDREAFEEYSLTIKAADNADVPKTATTQARILILDINDNPPTFQTPNAVTVKEDRSLLTSVATVNATDRDLAQHGVVTYFPDTVMVNGTVCPFKVSVETGVVKVSGDLDYETTSTYECIVTAVDMKRCSSCTGRLTGSTTMSVTILDFNDNPPVFQGAPYRANISRDADINTLVTDVITATDRDGVMDGNGVVKYHILSNINYFKIDRDSGDISVATTLDSVDEDEVTLRIMATDLPQADPAMEAITNVTISIMTDKPRPFFKKEYTFKLTENEKPDEDKRVPIRAYVRKESDEFACNCTYEILVTEYSESFYVDSMTGDLRQKDPIDREETGSHFYVTVKATDRGSGLQRTKQVAIIVADVNDNFPYFSKTQQNFAVLQSAPVGHEIGRVMSVDADELSDPIYTAFTDVEGIELLRNGTLVVRASLLNYTYVRMVVNVKEDHFKGTFNVLASTNAKVYINVRPDYNDHAPTFGKDTYEASLMFLSRKGTEVKINNFRATDADGDSVTYAIQRGNHRDTFTIDSHSGKISVQYTLDDTVPRVLDLVVIATDSSRYRRTGSCAVIISLRDFTATECIAENAYSELQQSAQQRVLFLGLFIAMAALLAVISLIAVFAVYKWRTLPKTKSMVAQEMHPVPTGYDLLGANMTEEERSYYRLRGRDAPPGVPNEAYVSASSRPTSYIHPVEGSPYYDDADADSIELQT